MAIIGIIVAEFFTAISGLGGMIVPVAIYLVSNAGGSGAHGWGAFKRLVFGSVSTTVLHHASSPVLIEKARSAVADSTGTYQIPNLQPGTYKLTFTLQGFSTVVREGVELSGAGVTTINAEMKVGAVAESVTVTGEATVLETARSQIAGTVQQSEVESLPMNGRNFLELALLIPGNSPCGN